MFRGHALTPIVLVVALAAGATACSDGDAGATGADTAERGEVIGDGDRYEATIRRTGGGIPHIAGKTLADVSYGQGWASGEDRTCDLADQVMKINGDRSLWLGAGDGGANVESDIAWKTIGIVPRAMDDWVNASPDVVDMVTGFTAGWNAHLAHVGPPAVTGWCAGADWLRPLQPVEVYAYARSIALMASSGALVDAIPGARPPGAEPDRELDNPPTRRPAGASTSGDTETGSETDTDRDRDSGDSRTATTQTSPTSPTTPTTESDSPGLDVLRGAGGDDGPPTAPHPPAFPSASSRPARPKATEAGEAAGGTDSIGALGHASSSGWAIGRARSASGGGLLLANPTFPWEGELRLWEVHLTVPGELDVYGTQLSGLPGIAIGFNHDVAWTQTVSSGHRFTAYRLDLVPGEPTAYRYGDDVRQMEATDVTVDVLDDDGSIDQVTRTVWSTHYGPVVDLPGIGWTEAGAVSYRDANLDDDELLDQYLAMARSGGLDQLVAAHRDVGGVPLFNTVATSRDGRAWYADTSATPNLSAAAVAMYEASLATDPQVRRAAGEHVVLLDGSEPAFEWVDARGARDSGLVPLDRLPQVERDDYVFNAGDSFWLPNAEATLDGDYSPLVGDQATARSPRTRETATLLGDTSPGGPAGDDGRFTLDELAGAALDNRGYTARALREAVVERCDGAPQVFLPRLAAEGEGDGEGDTDGGAGTPVMPPAGVYVGAACAVLGRWDGTYDLDQAGPPLWREMLHQLDAADLRTAGRLWARPFDARRPVQTPSGLAPPPATGRDPVLDALARAVQILDSSGIAVDATLGDVQFAQRGRERVPIHGGDDVDGTVNVVGPEAAAGAGPTILDPQLAVVAGEREPVAAGSTLGRYGDVTGYLVDGGTSYLMAVELTEDGPRARTLMPYSDSEDRTGDDYAAATRRFSDKEWRDVAFTEDEIADQATETLTVRG